MNDVDFLHWIHDRLVSKHGEKAHFDYMHRLRKVIYDMQRSGSTLKVFEVGEFYDGAAETEVTEREFVDTDGDFIIQSRSGQVGIYRSVCQQDYVEWIDGDDKQYRIECASPTPQPVVPEGYNEMLVEYIRDDFECVQDGDEWCFIDLEGQEEQLKYLRDHGLLIQHPTDPERVKVKALLSAGKETDRG